MDTEDVQAQVEDLGVNIDDLESALQPVLKTALSTSASKLPLLDKAKLYVLATYAVESILFSALRLHGVDAKAHPIFKELARVKEYFNKVKKAETGPVKRSTAVDKEAAGRFIKAGLQGNEKYDRHRAERLQKEKAGAKRKLEEMSVGTHTRFDGAAKRIKAQEGGDEADVSEPAAAAETPKLDKKAEKRLRKAEKEMAKQAQQTPADSPAGEQVEEEDGEMEESAAAKATIRRTKSSKPPKSHSETFQALLEAPLPKAEEKEKGKKGKKKKKKSLPAGEE
jgi:exosome complex protein LRP1